MKIRFLRSVTVYPDGVTAEEFTRGEVASLPERRAVDLIRAGKALSLEENGHGPDAGPDGLAEGVVAPGSDGQIRQLHAKGAELAVKKREAKAAVQQGAQKRKALQEQAAESEVGRLLGESAKGPSAEEIAEAREQEEQARQQLENIERAEAKLAERISEHLERLDASNREAAERAHADFLEHVKDRVRGACEALEQLKEFQSKHAPYLSELGPKAVPLTDVDRLKRWISRQED